MLIRVSVPKFRKVKDEDDSYTVFVVDVWVSGRHHVVEHRYTDFEELHKQIKKMTKTPEFPPKKVLKWNNKVLEHRRLALETYLQGVVCSEAVPKPIVEFLQIKVQEEGIDLDKVDGDNVPMHQHVVSFIPDAFLQDVHRGTLPDIIAEGVTIGLFDSDYNVPVFPS